MSRKIFTLFISLLVASALAALAQSPTTSAPPGASSTQEPIGATLDHPNPTGNTQPVGTTTTTTVATTPNPATPASPTTDSSTMTDSNAGATTSATTTNNNMATPAPTTTTTTTDTSAATDVNTPATLPRTGSELPLLAALGLLALGGAMTARTFAKRSA
jgi:LPXTG-motif cell wall-anchored protein